MAQKSVKSVSLRHRKLEGDNLKVQDLNLLISVTILGKTKMGQDYVPEGELKSNILLYFHTKFEPGF